MTVIPPTCTSMQESLDAVVNDIETSAPPRRRVGRLTVAALE